MRVFNTDGPIRSDEHYCVPPLERLDLKGVYELFRLKKYFVLRAPRQTGKTTTLRALRDLLNEGAAGDLRCVYASVEGAEAGRNDIGSAVRGILNLLADRARAAGDDALAGIWKGALEDGGPFDGLRSALFRWAQVSPKPIVLLLDEMDALVDDTLLSVLHQLRAGYADRPEGFPQSVVLCGLRDVRAYRMPPEVAARAPAGQVPFNIVSESFRLRDFDEAETRALLTRHTEETGQEFESEALEAVWRQTQGQPGLVNAIADEACFRGEAGRDRRRPVTAEDIGGAVEALIVRRNTHLDRLAAKLRDERVRRVIEPVLTGATLGDASVEDIRYVRDLGLTARDGPTRIANPIYREFVPRELMRTAPANFPPETRWFATGDGALDVEESLSRFQQYFRERSEHAEEPFDYPEAEPHLLLQAFCQRIVDDGGRVEREYGFWRQRADLLLEWPRGEGRRDRFVVECRVLGKSREATEREGLEQTMAYMDRSGAATGHLVIFDRSGERSWREKIYRREAEQDGFPITIWGM